MPVPDRASVIPDSHARPSVRFALGLAGLVLPGLARAQTAPDARPADPPAPAREEEHTATVRGSVVRDRTASEYIVPVQRFDIVPRVNAGDAVGMAPGVWVSQDNGEGHAQHVYLRGFYGEDGSDVAISLDGVPLNQVGHPEHHGLVDLATVIPELIQRVDATAGVADPRQGDFAVAGSLDLHLGLHDRGFVGRATVGSFGYARVAALWGPRHGSEETFLGAEVVRGDGFGPSRGFSRANAMGQLVVPFGHRVSLRLNAGLFVSRYQSAGPVRQDDVDAGRIDFFGSYPIDARGLGGGTGGAIGSATLNWSAPLQHGEARVYAIARDTTLTEDFTGYLVHPDQGDRSHFAYTVGTLGSNGSYRHGLMLGRRLQEFEVGWNLRFDRFFASERAVDGNDSVLSPPGEGDVATGSNLVMGGSYADVVIRPFSWLTLRGGARMDLASYDAQVATYESAAGITYSHVTASGVRAGPKATLDLHIGHGWSVLASYGSGFRSPDPLQIASGEPFVFGEVSGQDLGVRYAMPAGPSHVQFVSTLTGFHSSITHDVTFDPLTGEEADIGPTDRLGAALWGRMRWRGLDVNASVTWTHAIAGQDALEGQVRAGLPLPNLPAVVARVDAALDQPIGRLWHLPLRMRAGLGTGVRSAPPLLTVGGYPTVLLDAAVGLRLGPFALDLASRNLLDLRQHDAQFEYPSTFTPGAMASPTPALHFTAGAPRTIFVTGTIYL